jgi:hypothetical protein
MRTTSAILWVLSVIVLVIGGISRLTMAPIVGLTARAFLGLALVLQLYVITLYLKELVQQGRR